MTTRPLPIDVQRDVETVREALGIREWGASISRGAYAERVEREMPAAFGALDRLAAAASGGDSDPDYTSGALPEGNDGNARCCRPDEGFAGLPYANQGFAGQRSTDMAGHSPWNTIKHKAVVVSGQTSPSSKVIVYGEGMSPTLAEENARAMADFPLGTGAADQWALTKRQFSTDDGIWSCKLEWEQLL